MKPTSTELDVECPKCGAIPGERCREKRIKRSHMGRRLEELREIILGQLPTRNERSLWVGCGLRIEPDREPEGPEIL